jgi:hypothetical protein
VRLVVPALVPSRRGQNHRGAALQEGVRSIAHFGKIIDAEQSAKDCGQLEEGAIPVVVNRRDLVARQSDEAICES